MEFLSDPQLLLTTLGPLVIPGVALIIFVESGLLFPFLPGDSLIFAAAMLHQQLGFSVVTLIICCILAAFLGVQVGYIIGAKFGRRFFTDDARILKTEYLERAEAFFDKHGAASLILARFVPIVRTFVPIAAGVARMNYPRFVLFNMIGALAWILLMSGAGLLLGNIPLVANNIDIIAILIVAISVVPIIIGYLRERSKNKKATSLNTPQEEAEEITA